MGKITTLLVTAEPAMLPTVRALLDDEHVQLLEHHVHHARGLVAIENFRPDVVLIDATSDAERALQLISGITHLSHATKVLLIQPRCTEAFVSNALARGCSGCLDLQSLSTDLVRAVRSVHLGELWASRKVLGLTFRNAFSRAGSSERASHATLSKREYEIVEWMRCGLSNKEIARKLGISDMTVKTHAHNIFGKLEVSGRLRLLGQTSQSQDRVMSTSKPLLAPDVPRHQTRHFKPAA